MRAAVFGPPPPPDPIARVQDAGTATAWCAHCLEFDSDQCIPGLKLLSCDCDGPCDRGRCLFIDSTSKNLRPLGWAAFVLVILAGVRGLPVRATDRPPNNPMITMIDCY